MTDLKKVEDLVVAAGKASHQVAGQDYEIPMSRIPTSELLGNLIELVDGKLRLDVKKVENAMRAKTFATMESPSSESLKKRPLVSIESHAHKALYEGLSSGLISLDEDEGNLLEFKDGTLFVDPDKLPDKLPLSSYRILVDDSGDTLPFLGEALPDQTTGIKIYLDGKLAAEFDAKAASKIAATAEWLSQRSSDTLSKAATVGISNKAATAISVDASKVVESLENDLGFKVFQKREVDVSQLETVEGEMGDDVSTKTRSSSRAQTVDYWANPSIYAIIQSQGLIDVTTLTGFVVVEIRGGLFKLNLRPTGSDSAFMGVSDVYALAEGVVNAGLMAEYPELLRRSSSGHSGVVTIHHALPKSVVTLEGAFSRLPSGSRVVFKEKWDTSNVSSFKFTWEFAEIIPEDVNDWDVSNATILWGMFSNAYIHDHLTLSKYDISNAESLIGMFNLSSGGKNVNLENWSPVKCKTASMMFTSSTAEFVATMNLANWNVSSISNFSRMFEGTAFSGDISGWNTSSATDMSRMFNKSKFNSDISNWDWSKISTASGLIDFLKDNTVFNQDLSKMCVSNIPSAPVNFDDGCSAWVLPRPVWGTCPSD